MKPRHLLSDQFVQLLLESLGDGVFTLNSNGIITSWNPSMERITGYGMDEAIGNGCGMLCFSQCFGKQCPINLGECGILDSGKVDPTECYLKHKNGRSVPVIKNARVMRKPDGSVIGIVEAVTDLTDLEKARKKMEEDSFRLGKLYQFQNIIGKSHAMQQVFSSIKAAAACDATVLIQGESGTGKELVAGAIHFESDRKHSRMITVNCSALPESLLESELFGHIRGAFTGALQDRTGRFEDADGGTIFLDEIGEISPLIQLKLLRVLEEHRIERVGESKSRQINIRIITATNQDLFKLVNTGNFREDLYYRLKVFPVYPPPLRKRKEDIPLLVNHFIEVFNRKAKKQIRGISPSTMRLFMDYEWPGNVRELENAMEHAFVLCQEDPIDVFDIPVEIRQVDYFPRSPDRTPWCPPKGSAALKLNRDILLRLLTECQWNKAEVARRVGLSRAAIWKYMKKFEIPLKP